MPVLDDAKKEAFAGAVARGLSQADAYRKAYPSQAKKKKATSIRTLASKLANIKAVKERISEIRTTESLSNTKKLTEDEVIQNFSYLALHARADSDRIKASDALAKIFGLYSKHNKQSQPMIKIGMGPLPDNNPDLVEENDK